MIAINRINFRQLFTIKGTIVLGFVILASTNIKAAPLCFQVLLAKETSHEFRTIPIVDLKSLSKAMTEGALLHSDQVDLFEIYRQIYFGDSNANKESANQSLSKVFDILSRHPELEKPHFREYEISQTEKIYEIPESLAKYLKSQVQTAGSVRSNLFQIEANLGFWKKIFDYQEFSTPMGLTKEQQKEFSKNEKKKFEKYLNKIISKANRNLLADLKNNNEDYQSKVKALYGTLTYIQKWMDKRGRKTQAIRQAMIDLIHTAGFGNQAIQVLLKSQNGMDKIEGLKKLLDERDSLAMSVAEGKHFDEFLQSLKIDFPTGLSKNQNHNVDIQNLEKEVLQGRFSKVLTKAIRVRSLSIQEAPFRSCLGGSDCSSRTYFDKALDPNFNYFTMTNAENYSNGHATVVLGEATNPKTGDKEKVALVDKLQNISNHKIPTFMQAVSKSLAEKGYKLVFPVNVGDHNGLSNMDTIRHYVDKEILPQLKTKLVQFIPHSHKYNFENAYSRAYSKLNVKIYENIKLDEGIIIVPGAFYQSTMVDKNLNKNTLVQELLSLRDSSNPEDVLKYISSSQLVEIFNEVGLYSKDQYFKDLENISSNLSYSLNLRKQAVFSLSYDLHRTTFLFNWLLALDDLAFKQVLGEVSSYKNSHQPIKAYIFKRLSVSELVSRNEDLGTELLTRILLLTNAELNLANDRGETALMAAVRNGNNNLVEILLSHGADANAVDNSGSNSIHYSANIGSIELAKRLQKSGANIKVISQEGYSALMISIKQGYKELAQFFIKNGVGVNLVDTLGNTALSYALKSGNEELIELLLNYGAHIDTINKEGTSTLIYAANYSSKKIVEDLLNRGADVNYIGSGLNTALLYAANFGKVDIVEVLLAHGADVDHVNKNGDTALNLASQYGHLPVAELLQRHHSKLDLVNGSGRSPLLSALVREHQEVAEFLMNHGANLDVVDYDKETALGIALKYGQNRVVQQLINRGYHLDTPNIKGNTPLIFAISNGSFDFVKLLIKKGTNVNIKNNEKNTPLIYAANVGLGDIVKLLLKNGATINSVNNDHSTALIAATIGGYIDVVKILLQNGALVNVKNNNDESALGSALRMHRQDIVELLIKHGAVK